MTTLEAWRVAQGRVCGMAKNHETSWMKKNKGIATPKRNGDLRKQMRCPPTDRNEC